MFKAALLVLVTLLLTGCQRASTPSLPAVAVDDKHNHLRGDAAETYTIVPATGFVLDASGYTFSVPQPLAGVTAPNAIQFIVEGTVYSVPWRSGTVHYELVPSARVPVRGPVQDALKAGTKVVVAIGFEKPPEPDGTAPFWPFWVSLVQVRPGA
jgi:hypothetical protein